MCGHLSGPCTPGWESRDKQGYTTWQSLRTNTLVSYGCLDVYEVFPLIFNEPIWENTYQGTYSYLEVYTPKAHHSSYPRALRSRSLRDLCSFVFGATPLKQQPLHGLASLLQMNYSLAINISFRLNIYGVFT